MKENGTSQYSCYISTNTPTRELHKDLNLKKNCFQCFTCNVFMAGLTFRNRVYQKANVQKCINIE